MLAFYTSVPTKKARENFNQSQSKRLSDISKISIQEKKLEITQPEYHVFPKSQILRLNRATALKILYSSNILRNDSSINSVISVLSVFISHYSGNNCKNRGRKNKQTNHFFVSFSFHWFWQTKKTEEDEGQANFFQWHLRVKIILIVNILIPLT